MVENQVAVVKPAKDKALEHQLETSGQLTIKEAMSLNIESQKDYEQAGKFLVEIKTRAKQVKDYWAQPKTAAKNAHQTIVDREKAMLAPLMEAEKWSRAACSTIRRRSNGQGGRQKKKPASVSRKRLNACFSRRWMLRILATIRMQRSTSLWLRW